MSTKGFVALLICALTGSAEPVARPTQGIPPKANRADYYVTAFTHTIGIGASLVSVDQASRLFGPDLGQSFHVIEVGFYSKTHATFPVAQRDFTLRLRRSGVALRPVTPSELRAVDKVLPQVATSNAVAGYLFFPIATRIDGRDRLELDYEGNGAWLSMRLEPK